MFEQAGMRRAAGDTDFTPIPAATVEVSHPEATPEFSPADRPSWREMPTGPEMIAALAQVPLQACTDAELLDVLAGWQRAEAWLAAQQVRALHRTSERLLDTAVREQTDLDGNTRWDAVDRQVETEISTAMRWTSRFTNIRLNVAKQLSDRLPHALDALAAGQLTYRHAEMICDETVTLTEQQARRVVDRLLPEASTKTVGGLRKRLRKACLQIDPDAANERAERAAAERSVTIRPLPDGLAQLQAIGPAATVLAMFRTLNDTASQAGKDDPRTQTARRFDALSHSVLGDVFAGISSAGSGPSGWPQDWPYDGEPPGPYDAPDGTDGWDGWMGGPPGGPFSASGGCNGTRDCPPPGKISALVQITMDLPTLLGLRNNPAELHGYGPLPAVLARELAVNGDWQRFIQDPVTGAPADLGRTRRHPTAGLRRWIIARDRTCLFPECYRPAVECEPDHNPAWEHGGGSNKDTLNQLCPKHHKVRHHGWHYQRHPDRITWTSPAGQTYERQFTEADLVGDADACPHVEQDFDDAVWPPMYEDQRISPFLPQPRSRSRDIHEFRPPARKIPWEVVEAFGLNDAGLWPCDADGNPVQPLDLTAEERLAIFEEEDRLINGDPEYEKTERYRWRSETPATWDNLPDDPPF